MSEFNNDSVVIFTKSMTVVNEFRSNGTANLLEDWQRLCLQMFVIYLARNTIHFPAFLSWVLSIRPALTFQCHNSLSQLSINTFSNRKFWLKLTKVFVKLTHFFHHFIVHLRHSALQWSVLFLKWQNNRNKISLQQFIQRFFSVLRHGHDSYKVKVRLLCFRNKILHQRFNLTHSLRQLSIILPLVLFFCFCVSLSSIIFITSDTNYQHLLLS